MLFQSSVTKIVKVRARAQGLGLRVAQKKLGLGTLEATVLIGILAIVWDTSAKAIVLPFTSSPSDAACRRFSFQISTKHMTCVKPCATQTAKLEY